MTTRLHAELVADAGAVVGEGPVWDAGRDALWWVDIDGRRLHRFDPSSDTDATWETPSMPGAVALRAGGGLVLALADRIVLADPPSSAGRRLGALRPLLDFDDGAGIRSNDGKCDPFGRFLIGRMALDESPVGRLLSVRPDGSSGVLLEDVSISNGLAWSAEGRTLYYIDTPTRRVDAMDYDAASGAVSNRRVHLDLSAAPGVPDGMTIDAEGCLWVALWGGSEVRRYGPGGQLSAIVSVPASQVTSCTFGGPHLADLYITTAARGLAEPLAGGLFRVRPGVRGVPGDVFGG